MAVIDVTRPRVPIVAGGWAFLSIDTARSSYAPRVPVSRKRKKSRKTKTSPRGSRPRLWPGMERRSPHQLVDALPDLDTHRRRLNEHRASLAVPAAEAVVARLVELAPVRGDADLEDDLCALVGAPLLGWSSGPVEDHVGPNPFVMAIFTAAAAAVATALDEVASAPDGWRTPWRVLTTVARTVPAPLSALATDAIADLRRSPRWAASVARATRCPDGHR